MDYASGGSASEVLGHLAAGVAGGVAGNTELLKMAQSGKQAVKPTIDSLPDKVGRSQREKNEMI
jgi:hypothetical protein